MGARKKLALEQFNRDNILTAARELFETKGVQDTTMDDIALQADYSKSTIYVYFRSKEDIYNSIVVDYLDILIGEMTVYIEGDTSFEDSYYKLCERLVSFCERYPKYYASLMFEEKATNSRKQGTVILPEILQEALVQKGKNTNVLQETLDTKPTVLYLWSSLSGIIQISAQKKKEITKQTGMTMEEYRSFAFRTLYESLVQKKASGE
jgi:AcrR family transcriptional regulator